MPKYHFLESLSMKTSNLQENLLRVIMLNNIMKNITSILEHNKSNMCIKSWDSREIIISQLLLSNIYNMIVSNIMSKILILYNKF